MSKFTRKLLTNTAPAKDVAGVWNLTEYLQNGTAKSPPPTITGIQIYSDNTFTTLLDDTAIGLTGYIKILGTDFIPGSTVYVGGSSSNATTTIISTTEIRSTVTVTAYGTYSLMVFNSSGGGIFGAGILVSGIPVVSSNTYSNIGSSVSVQLLATGDTPLSFSLQSGSSLPPGLTLSSSGLLSGTATDSVTTVYTFTVLVNDPQLQTTQETITFTLSLGEPYFKYNTLLVHGDGSSGQTNNTILDSSTANNTITRSGTPSQGTFTPFSNAGWGVYFNGSNDYISIPYSSAIDVGTGVFTWEAWIYPLSVSTGRILGSSSASGNSGYFRINSGKLEIGRKNVGADLSSSTNVVINAWQHVAVSRDSSNVLRLFINGVQVGSATSTANFGPDTQQLYIGQEQGVAFFSGYMSNLRIVKGTAVYTAAFGVPNSRLPNITNTALLTLQYNRIFDASNNAVTLTPAGSNIKVVPIAGTVPPESYTTANIGGSIQFNGTSDYLTTPSTGQFVSSGDFTIETWAYLNSLSTSPILLGNYTSTASTDWKIAISSGGTLTLTYQGTLTLSSSAGAVLPNQWMHIAVVRNGTTLSLYLNGVSVASATISGSFGSATKSISISSSSGYVNGFLSNVRIVSGTAVYTAQFTPPTAPVTAITNTVLLLSGTNAGIIDHTAKSNFITVGTAQINTTTKKFGSGSMYFDGSSYAYTPTNQYWSFGTGDFTVEAWVNFASLGANRIIVDAWNTSQSGSWQLYYSNGNTKFTWYVGGATVFTSTTTPNTGTWYHVAVTRSSGTLRMFVNGTLEATVASNTTDLTHTCPLAIGCQLSTVTNIQNGYIDDVRITKGIARYTANFSVPTAALPDQ